MAPIGVAFNTNDSNFFVVTPNELRVYCGATGRLNKIFSEVLDPRSQAELRTFSLDSRHRKLFCGDASGTVRSLNLSNGVPILTLTNRSNEEFDEMRAEVATKGKNCEITGIHIATGFSAEQDDDDLGKSHRAIAQGESDDNEEKAEASVIVISSWDHNIRVIDEKDNGEDSGEGGLRDPEEFDPLKK